MVKGNKLIYRGNMMTKLKNITRREFISGVAVSAIVAGMSPQSAWAKGVFQLNPDDPYPPMRNGMRGSHTGSFEVAHALAWSDERPNEPSTYTDSDYDLVIMGAGLSGLTSAWLARKKLGRQARILLLDNHDDFGGHAKRNEFEVKGKRMVGYGGSQSLSNPGKYSAETQDVFRGLGIKTEKFHDYFDQKFYDRQGMAKAIHFAKKHYGKNILAKATTSHHFLWSTPKEKENLTKEIAGWPMREESKTSLRRLLIDRHDWLEAGMPGASDDEKRKALREMSYKEALIKYAGLTEEAYSIFSNDFVGQWGIDWEGLSAMEAIVVSHPGITMIDLALSNDIKEELNGEPYIFHFPDGNASIARLLVRDLVPGSIKADTMEKMVTATMQYDRLDRAQNHTRIRLNSTVIEAKNKNDFVEVTYVRDGKAEKVRARKSIMAGYAHILPHILTEMLDDQRAAIDWAEKTPLVYVNVALTNWRAWKKAGVSGFHCPNGFYNSIELDFPVSMGGINFSSSPDDPILLHLGHYPRSPGLTQREQHLKGRHDLYALTFDDFETAIVDQLTEALGPYGFDANNDIAAITVNRWPHGYAYEYNELFDDPSFGPFHGTADGPDKGPHVLGRRSIGNISIAGSDASAYAYVNGAMDAAARAVEVLYK